MSFRPKVWSIAPTLFAAVLCSTAFANADCVRHIYNTSKKMWTFDFAFAGGGPFGMELRGCEYDPTAPYSRCKLKPGKTATYDIVNASPIYVEVTDANGTKKHFDMETTLGSGDCLYIDHDGNTGSVTLNDPADGDLNAGGDTW